MKRHEKEVGFNRANSEMIEEYAAKSANYFRHEYQRLLNGNLDDAYRLTPIEGRFALGFYWRMMNALVAEGFFEMHEYQATEVTLAQILDNNLMIFRVKSHYLMHAGYEDEFWIVVDSQHETSASGQDCRIDFLISIVENPAEVWTFIRREFEPVTTLAIELDGHDFHEKTKEQAARDKRRERNIVKCGFPVLRFTGSEVFHGVDAVLTETLEHLYLEFRKVVKGRTSDRQS